RVYDYRLSFRPTSNCFRKGHRIRIEVTSSDMDRHARNQNVADAPGTTPMWRSPSRRSTTAA
ncbi:MAG: hypothetical protein FJ077_11810, partial [Cyanobacteria bacterium K_DeepCast_35m_m2_023]|nr:hypothetical protein [Cyanobacteria bacterium K_DeepCast_35m_m2_023]